MTLEQTSRLLVWVIVGLIALGTLLYFFGPAQLRTVGRDSRRLLHNRRDSLVWILAALAR